MANKWKDTSEVVGGLVLKGKLPADVVNPTDMYPPYGEIVKLMREEKDLTDMVIADNIGFAAVSACLTAIDTVNGDIQPLQWLKILETTASRAKSGVDLAKVAKDLSEGKEVDVGLILAAAGRIETGYRELTPLSDVEPTTVKFIKTGYKPLDEHVGGIPPACVTIVGASPGVGKTTFAMKLMKYMIRTYKKKTAAFFSLEMTMGQIAQRFLELDKSMTKDEKARIIMDDSSYSVHEVYAAASKAAANYNLCVIVIDFADLLVEGEQTESVMGLIYRNLSMLAKKTGIPVLLISQLNRSTYTGGLPRINHLRYSGLAEATARLILLLYNPNNIMIDFEKEKSELQAVEGRGYILVGKSSFGYKEGFPGGIMVEWDGAMGWGDKSYGYWKVSG